MATKLMPSKLFVEELVAALNRKDGYILKAYGQNPRTGYLDLTIPESKCKDDWKLDGIRYTQYKNSPKEYAGALKWRKESTRVWDCNGMVEGIYELYSGTCINSTSTKNYRGWCSPKGSGIIPAKYRVPGAAVFWSYEDGNPDRVHHIGYLWKPVKEGYPEDDWYIIEAAGAIKGVVQAKLYSRKPNFWGWMTKYIDYSDATVPQTYTYGSRDLKKGCKGADVKELQNYLLKLGYKLPKYGADGSFGNETLAAVKDFQTNEKLTVDGVMNKADYEVLNLKINPKKILVTGNSVNVRNAAGVTGTQVLGVVYKNNKLIYLNETTKVDDRDWYKVQFENQIGWISSKYSKMAE